MVVVSCDRYHCPEVRFGSGYPLDYAKCPDCETDGKIGEPDPVRMSVGAFLTLTVFCFVWGLGIGLTYPW